MSDNIYEGATLYVTRYVGPEDEGPDRQRWQVTPLAGDTAILTRDEALALARALSESAGRA